MRSILTSLLFLALAGPALAVDGVLEINQTCAVNTGCFAGDTAGFPVTTNVSDSFKLTSSLKLPDGNTTGIEITGSGVTIDLNGFTVGCFPGICTAGTGNAIGADLTLQIPPTTVRVLNGTVQGAGNRGVDLGLLSVVENVIALGNRNHGIFTTDLSSVSRCRAIQNGWDGIQVGKGSAVESSIANLNILSGIVAGLGSTISGNTAYQNGDDGIVAVSGSIVQRNTVRGNGGYGLNLGGATAYRENVITSNLTGSVSSGVNLGVNLCSGIGVVSASCP